MNSVANLKLTQLRKLFTMFKSSPLKTLNIFGPWKGSVFYFQSLNGFNNYRRELLTKPAHRPVAQNGVTGGPGHLVPHAPTNQPVSLVITLSATATASLPLPIDLRWPYLHVGITVEKFPSSVFPRMPSHSPLSSALFYSEPPPS
jgi:hypothetical protein